MWIAILNDMEWGLEVQRYAQMEKKKYTTFGNLKGVDIFKVVKKPIKQMKRLQNPRMVDGDGRNDTKGM
jgi:hypothetical protein